MAQTKPRAKQSKAPRQQKQKQGHKLVWLTLIIIAIPVVIVGYVLLTSLDEQNQPVEGIRFSSTDLNPSITNQQMKSIESSIKSIDGVEKATMNLKSATLRLHLNVDDSLDRDTVYNILEQARDIVNTELPFDTYFTNTEEGKNYDVEIDVYNWIIDDAHPADGQIYFKLTKTGAGGIVVDEISSAKNWDLVNSIVRNGSEEVVEESGEGENTEPEEVYDEYYEYYDYYE